jgi:hypothetical protein
MRTFFVSLLGIVLATTASAAVDFASDEQAVRKVVAALRTPAATLDQSSYGSPRRIRLLPSSRMTWRALFSRTGVETPAEIIGCRSFW